MNDPHVQAMHYDNKHADFVDFDRAPLLVHDEPAFSVQIDKGHVTVTMKDHYVTVESARTVVEPFLRAWELAAALQSPTDRFEFSFQNGEVIDRKPTPGGIQAAIAIAVGVGTMTADSHIGHDQYPAPPVGLACDAYVDLMLYRYRMYHENRTTLSDAANFYLTALTAAAGGRRQAAAKHFGIALPILNNLGMLAGEKGGKEARKANAAKSGYTSAERDWLETAMKAIIRRAAEVAHNSTLPHKQITMADLPPIP
jgi:hypothetical protein